MAKELYPKNSQVIQKPGMKVPAVLHSTIPGAVNKKTLDSLERLAADGRIFNHIAALNDAHQKKDLASPTGSVVASKTHIMPQLFDSAPNCGMRVITTDLTDDDLNDENIAELSNVLSSKIKTKGYIGKYVPRSVGIQSFLHGSQPVADYLNTRIRNEIEHTHDQGDLFKNLPKSYALNSYSELANVIAPLLIFLGQFRLGLLGATSSHFLTLMRVDELLDPKQAEKLGLKQGQYIFYMHTGSGIIGRFIGYLYSPQARSTLQNLEFNILKTGFSSPEYKQHIAPLLSQWTPSDPLLGYEQDAPAGRMAVQALQAAGNQGFANRTVLSHQLDHALEDVFGRQLQLDLVYDAPHILLSREKHYGDDVWVHRNGATRARGPQAHGETGEPAFLAPFEYTDAYVGVGTDSNPSTFFSANHELGKKKFLGSSIQFSNSKKDRSSVLEIAGEHRRRVHTKQRDHLHGKRIAEEIAANNILKLVARMTPITHLTHRHG